MKNYIHVIFASITTISISLADVCPTTQNRNQNRLALAASYAIENNNIELLMSLKNAGWDPALTMGKNLEGFEDNMTPLNYAVLFGASKSLKWLLEECDLPKDLRDKDHLRPIDVLIDKKLDPLYIELHGENAYRNILRLLHRDNKPSEVDAITEISYIAFRKFSPSKFSITSVNDGPALDTWNPFLERLNQLSIEHANEQDELTERRLLIRWEMTGDTEYHFHITHDNDGWGGGVSGKIRHEFGYWIPIDLQFWDS